MHSLPVSDRRRAIDMQPPSVPALSAASSSPVGQGARSPARRSSWRCAPAAPAPAAGWFSTPGESSLGRTHRVHNGPHTYSCTVSNPRIRVQLEGQLNRSGGHEGTRATEHEGTKARGQECTQESCGAGSRRLRALQTVARTSTPAVNFRRSRVRRRRSIAYVVRTNRQVPAAVAPLVQNARFAPARAPSVHARWLYCAPTPAPCCAAARIRISPLRSCLRRVR